MSDNSIDDHKPKTVVRVGGDEDRMRKYNTSFSEEFNHNHSDNLKRIDIYFDGGLSAINRGALDANIHTIREIFSKCISDDVYEMSVKVFENNDFAKHSSALQEPNSIHVGFGNVGNEQILIYSWSPSYQLDGNKWNNFLSQLERDYEVRFLGIAPLQFKYEGFDYTVYPPAFSFLQIEHPAGGKAYKYIRSKIPDNYKNYEPSAFSFSQKEADQIIENIKRSHNSIKKQVIDHYQPSENDPGYVKIGTDINSKTKLSSIQYFNASDDVILELKVEYKTTPLHLWAKLEDSLSQWLEGELDKGADVNAMDENEKTALHLAAEKGRVKMVRILLDRGADVNAIDENGKTPFDLTTNEEIKTLLQNAEKTDPVDESSTDSKGDQEEDAGTQQKEKQEGNVQPGSDITGQNSDNTEPQSDNNKKEEEKTNTISAEKGTDIKAEGVKAVAPIEPAQTEEQPSSFFGSSFSILMKPFSLIASFFGGFFSWLFGSDEPTQSLPESDQPVVLEPPSNSGDNDII